MTRTLDLSLITLGDPATMTGGYLYHQRMAAAAPRHGAMLTFVSIPEQPFPLALAAGGSALARAMATKPAAILIDSIAAAYLALALARRGSRGVPL
ncbi:MAG: hypothetical protein M0Z94_01375, partial [Dehalococcoidales bacterium]|nr:hypothetical protein [Dehalococcoidales bacterium]